MTCWRRGLRRVVVVQTQHKNNSGQARDANLSCFYCTIMKKHSFLLLFVVFAVLSAVSGIQFWFPPEEVRAQSTGSTAEEFLERKVGIFFRDLEQPNLSTTSVVTAFEELFRDDSSTPRTSSEEVENMSKSFMELSDSGIGRFVSSEKIDSKSMGKDVIFLRYLAKHENAPVLWTFRFYSPPSPRGGSTPATTAPSTSSISGWNLNRVHFDTDLESAR